MDFKVLNPILLYDATKVEAASIMECNVSTIEVHIRKEHDMTFTEYKHYKMGKSRLSLKQKAFKMAMNGDKTMMIFLLKNWCKYQDSPEPEGQEYDDLEFVVST